MTAIGSAPRTLQAVREIIFTALTSPALQYYKDLGGGSGYSLLTLPTANVVPRAIWNVGPTPPPSPYICFAVRGRGQTSRYIGDRRMTATFWCVSELEDEVTELYEAVRSKVNLADQDVGPFATDMSTIGTLTNLGAIFREFIETNAYEPTWDRVTTRWQLVAEYSVIAA